VRSPRSLLAQIAGYLGVRRYQPIAWEAYMKLLRFCLALVFAAVAGCVSLSDGPTSAARNELAPTGKLRVGVASAPARTALFVVKDANGQPSGVTVDLGKELGRRLGVPVEF